MNGTRNGSAPLAGVSVLELGGGVAGAYCGKLFADMGADVSRIEPRGGDPLRDAELEPGFTDTAGLYFRYLNAGKRVVTGPETAQPPALVIAGEACGWESETPAAAIATIDLTWFGADGPYAHWAGSDLIVQALAGLVYPVGPVEGPPSFLGAHQATQLGGLAAYCAGVAALLGGAREAPVNLEVSILESLLILAEHQVCFSEAMGSSVPRMGINRFMPTCPVSIHRCKTGWIGITPLTPAQWQSFCDMLDLPELASDPALQVPRDRYPHAARMEAAFDARFPERTADEWAAIGREQKVPMVIVPDALGILDHPIFNARESFAQFEHGERTFRVPRTPLRLERSVPRRALDEIGDASEDQTGNPTGDQTGTSSAAPLAPTICGDDTSPLAGVRIADFSMGWAGPLATRMLADLGAEVVKIEAGRYPDWWRSVDWAPQAIADKQYEQSRNFCALNRGKKSISLDLTEQRGRALARAFVERCDIVVENQAAGVMPRLGLGYDDLASDRDDLIMLSMSAFGSGNAWSATRAYGSVLEQGSGLPSFAGHPADPPTMAHIAYGDPVGGIYGAASLLSALYFRQRMGHGQWINNTQIEAMLPFTTPALLIRQALGREPTRWGNRHPQMAPHGCFACADDAEGEDQWLSVSVTDDASWSALARVLGGEDWLQDTSLASVAGRRKREGEIEQAISQWCHGQDAGDAARALQAAGVAAAKVQRSGDVTSDPHLHSRSFFYLTERPYIGAQAQAGLPIRRDRERYPMRGIAPFLGGNSHEILCGLLGVTEDDYEALESSQVVSLQPTQLRQG